MIRLHNDSVAPGGRVMHSANNRLSDRLLPILKATLE